MKPVNARPWTVRVLKDRVEKQGDIQVMKIEALKLRNAHKIGKQTGLFSSPALLDYDEKTGLMTMEYLPQLTEFRRADLKPREMRRLASDAGIALAEVHNGLSLPQDMTIALPEEINGPDEVYLHGDFSGANICLSEGPAPKIVIIDWQMTNMHGGIATYGTRYFDVAWFVNNLFSKPAYKYLKFRDEEGQADAFLSSYCQRAGIQDYHAFGGYQKKLFRLKMKSRRTTMNKIKLLMLQKGHARWRSYVAKYG